MLPPILSLKLEKALVSTKESFVSNTKGQLNQKKSFFCLVVHQMIQILLQKVVEQFPLPSDIFFRILGRFLAKLFDFFSAEFAKVLFYTKKFKNDNGSLVLRRQKKIGFFRFNSLFSKRTRCRLKFIKCAVKSCIF